MRVYTHSEMSECCRQPGCDRRGAAVHRRHERGAAGAADCSGGCTPQTGHSVDGRPAEGE